MRELVTYRSMACSDNRGKEELRREQQLDLWLDNAVFWIIQLQISDEEGNPAKYSEALNKARQCLDRLQILLG